MLDNFRNGRWFIASAFIVASCSQGDTSRLTSPSTGVTAASNGAGIVGGSAAGDVKTGTGALEIIRLRMDRQTPGGASILRQYALPGETYFMNPGETIELWTEWDPNLNLVPTVIPANPRMTVDWGANQPNSPEDINCGSCLLRHTYREPGVYTVVVTLNDRSGTKVSRTFFLNSNTPDGCTPPTSLPIPSLDTCESSPHEVVASAVDGASYNVSGSFFGTNLTYSVQGFCGLGAEVSASDACPISIDSAGVVGFSPNCFYSCVRVTATNACGSTSQQFSLGCD